MRLPFLNYTAFIKSKSMLMRWDDFLNEGSDTDKKYRLIKDLLPKTVIFLGDDSLVAKNKLKDTIPSLICFDEDIESATYDLAYIMASRYFDGVGDGLFAELEKIIRKARYIFIDKSFAVAEINLCITYFTAKYQNFISFSIQTSAGEILLKINENAVDFWGKNNSGGYTDIKDTYTTDYYMNDCGGFDFFEIYKGKRLDQRLYSMFMLSSIKSNENILDIGCGRGELAYFIYLHSDANVVGLDYSEAAINIAKRNFIEADCEKLQYVQSDILKYQPKCKFNKVIVSDVIEHIEQDSLEKMFEKISTDILLEDGMLIGHTAPNGDNYNISYGIKRREARRLGLYIPENPRSVYEDLMHINEQTQTRLSMALKKYFKYVYAWIPLKNDFFGTLKNKNAILESIESNDIYCVASNSQINLDEIYCIYEQDRIEGLKRGDIKLNAEIPKLFLMKNEQIQLDVCITNNSDACLKSFNPFPINASYHIEDTNGNMVVLDGIRTTLPYAILPGTKSIINYDIRVPNNAGTYLLKLTLVQEGCFWFEECVDDIFLEIPFTVN